MANASTGQAAALPLANADSSFKAETLTDVFAEWRSEIERIFEERFAALSGRMEEQLGSIAAARLAKSRPPQAKPGAAARARLREPR